MQADPSLPDRNGHLLAEFEAAPWLLPSGTKALKYAGVHDLDNLLQLRATPFGKYPKTITLLTFNTKFAIMAQNCSEWDHSGFSTAVAPEHCYVLAATNGWQPIHLPPFA